MAPHTSPKKYKIRDVHFNSIFLGVIVTVSILFIALMFIIFVYFLSFILNKLEHWVNFDGLEEKLKRNQIGARYTENIDSLRLKSVIDRKGEFNEVRRSRRIEVLSSIKNVRHSIVRNMGYSSLSDLVCDLSNGHGHLNFPYDCKVPPIIDKSTESYEILYEAALKRCQWKRMDGKDKNVRNRKNRTELEFMNADSYQNDLYDCDKFVDPGVFRNKDIRETAL